MTWRLFFMQQQQRGRVLKTSLKCGIVVCLNCAQKFTQFQNLDLCSFRKWSLFSGAIYFFRCSSPANIKHNSYTSFEGTLNNIPFIAAKYVTRTSESARLGFCSQWDENRWNSTFSTGKKALYRVRRKERAFKRLCGLWLLVLICSFIYFCQFAATQRIYDLFFSLNLFTKLNLFSQHVPSISKASWNFYVCASSNPLLLNHLNV